MIMMDGLIFAVSCLQMDLVEIWSASVGLTVAAGAGAAVGASSATTAVTDVSPSLTPTTDCVVEIATIPPHQIPDTIFSRCLHSLAIG